MSELKRWLEEEFPFEVVDVLRGGAHGKNTMCVKHSPMDLMVTMRAFSCEKPEAWRDSMMEFIVDYLKAHPGLLSSTLTPNCLISILILLSLSRPIFLRINSIHSAP